MANCMLLVFSVTEIISALVITGVEERRRAFRPVYKVKLHC